MLFRPSPTKAKLQTLKLPNDHELVLARAREDLQTKTAIHQEIWQTAGTSSKTVDRHLRKDAEFVRQYGVSKRLDRLTEPVWNGTQEECWDMTALAVLLNGAEGAYRGPITDQFVSMTFSNVQLRQGDSGCN